MVWMVVGIAANVDGRWVQTDLGNGGAQALGMEKAEVPVAKSVGGMIKVVCGSIFPIQFAGRLTVQLCYIDRRSHEREDLGQVYVL